MSTPRRIVSRRHCGSIEPEVSAELCGDAYLAAIHWRRGDAARARRHLDSFNARTTKLEAAPSTYTLIDAYGALADVCVEMAAGGDRSALQTATSAADALRRSARLFPIGEPAALLYGGRVDWIRGRMARARRAWQRCVESSGRIDMRYEKARALHELGCHAAEPAKGSAQLAAARAAFESMGTPYEAEMCAAPRWGGGGTQPGARHSPG